MSRHEGVSCDSCLTSNFREIRFKCLICYDYDLCETCYENKVSTSRHSPSHPMQCILTRKDFDLYYGGEGITMDSPPSLTCPLCGKSGLVESNLQEHVNAQHLDNNVEVVCPICAAIPSGDPNLVTDDFATHLAIEHNTAHRGIDDPIGSRHMRRMFYPGRSVRGARAQRSANMNFTSGPSSTSVFSNVSGSHASSLPQVRDAMDPIAELLTQLTGVRRNAQQLQQTVSTASQLQELQAQLQLERQRASIIRQQLERLPGKIQTTQNGQATNQAASSKSYASAVKLAKKDSSTAQSDDDSRLLLSKIYEKDSNAESESRNIDIFEQSLFIQELIQSLPTDEVTSTDELPPSPHPFPAPARAIPADCGLMSPKPVPQTPSSQQEDTCLQNVESGSSVTVERSEEEDDSQTDNNVTTAQSVNEMENHIQGEIHKEPHGAENEAKAPQRVTSPQCAPTSEMKKDPTGRGSTMRQQQFTNGGAGAVAGLLHPQPTRPVSTFQVLVSGASEQ